MKNRPKKKKKHQKCKDNNRPAFAISIVEIIYCGKIKIRVLLKKFPINVFKK